jgi:hypothetical protein
MYRCKLQDQHSYNHYIAGPNVDDMAESLPNARVMLSNQKQDPNAYSPNMSVHDLGVRGRAR